MAYIGILPVVIMSSFIHSSFYSNVKALDINAYKLAFDRMKGAPKVSPESSEITVSKGETLYIHCASTEEIKWYFEESFDNIKEVISKDRRDGDTYLSSVHIPYALETLVGQYYCIKTKAMDFFNEFKQHLDDLEAQFNATSVYLFVTGTTSGVVPQNLKVLTAVHGVDFVAQCKPTSKDVAVELVNLSTKTTIGHVVRKKGVYVGFDSVDNDVDLLCRDKDRHNLFMLIDTQKLTRPAQLYRPIINSTVSNVALLGTSRTLLCEVACCTGRRVDLTWYFDGEPIVPNDRMHISDLSYTTNEEDFCLDTLRRTLTIERLTMEDAGSYMCGIKDIYRHTLADSFNFGNYKLYVLEVKQKKAPTNRLTRDAELVAEIIAFDTTNNPTMVNMSRSMDRPVRLVLYYFALPSLTSVEWYKDGRPLCIRCDHRYEEMTYPEELHLVIRSPTLYDIGQYTVVASAGAAQDSYNVSVFIYDKPTLTMGSINATAGEKVQFYCHSVAYPEPVFDVAFLPCPSLQWSNCLNNRTQAKNIDSLTTRPSRIEVILKITIEANVSGIVLCDAANSDGNAQVEGYLLIVHSSVRYAVGTALAILFATLVAAIVFVVRHFRRSIRDKLPLLVEDEGLAIPEQYEFPREKLRLGAQLGTGQFGVVLQGVASGIVKDGENTTVAVKLVRDQHDAKVLNVVLAELKVMLHIGHHLNVVNLLGAVTKNVPKNKVMMIVEYCKYGNIADFLRENRTYFIDELDHTTGHLSSNLTGEDCLNMCDTFEGHIFRTSHLCSWATQVARGMSFLAARSVLHGDLAARNVLLCPSNVVKICDFGLARTLYRTSVYKKTSEDPLPLKWLAVECVDERTFSTHSDVWAYGILLWEIFSLGTVPYPELENNAELVQMLKRGYRMEKPRCATIDIYNIMLNCWRLQPNGRPSFDHLYQWFYNMLPRNLLQKLDLLEKQCVSKQEEVDTVPGGIKTGANIFGYTDMNRIRRV